MNLESLIQIATLISVVIGFASLIYFISSFRREVNMQVLISFSERFEKIMDSFTEEFFIADLSENILPQ